MCGVLLTTSLLLGPYVHHIDPIIRDYPTHRLVVGTGQTLNIVMVVIGIVLLVRSRLRRLGRLAPRATGAVEAVTTGMDMPPSLLQRAAFAVALIVAITIPSNWTQDVPARYGARHDGLAHSRLYPPIDTSPSRD